MLQVESTQRSNWISLKSFVQKSSPSFNFIHVLTSGTTTLQIQILESIMI